VFKLWDDKGKRLFGDGTPTTTLEYRDQPCTFRFCFGLDELPTDAGIILIRGPRLIDGAIP
jgi:hypothetical protein